MIPLSRGREGLRGSITFPTAIISWRVAFSCSVTPLLAISASRWLKNSWTEMEFSCVSCHCSLLHRFAFPFESLRCSSTSTLLKTCPTVQAHGYEWNLFLAIVILLFFFVKFKFSSFPYIEEKIIWKSDDYYCFMKIPSFTKGYVPEGNDFFPQKQKNSEFCKSPFWMT